MIVLFPSILFVALLAFAPLTSIDKAFTSTEDQPVFTRASKKDAKLSYQLQTITAAERVTALSHCYLT